MRAELRWPPYPRRAGFCITDDTDSAELSTVRAVYDALAANGIRTTKTVWAFRPEEPCGIPPLPDSIQRGVTLEDPDYLRYCEWLGAEGFEIALHGATAGNNRSATTRRAFETLDRHFPRAHTYICHAKNADNPYWQEKMVAKGPLRFALSNYARGHHCSGEDPGSPYFWGDQCLERVRYIRLMRTRNLDTLAANPSMPYFEREKPFVRSWFSATKRSFRDATANEALDSLERGWGLTVLYQYLCRYADPQGAGPTRAFADGIARLVAHPLVWADTTSRLMDRLRLVQGVWLGAREQELVVWNTNDEPATELQIETSARLSGVAPAGVSAADGVVRIERLPARSALRLAFGERIEAQGRTAASLDSRGRGRGEFGHGSVWLNAGADVWQADGATRVESNGFALRFAPGLEALAPRSRASDLELTKLFVEQSGIIAREFLFKGRSVDSRRWLGSAEIALENHDNW